MLKKLEEQIKATKTRYNIVMFILCADSGMLIGRIYDLYNKGHISNLDLVTCITLCIACMFANYVRKFINKSLKNKIKLKEDYEKHIKSKNDSYES